MKDNSEVVTLIFMEEAEGKSSTQTATPSFVFPRKVLKWVHGFLSVFGRVQDHCVWIRFN